jgi:hypothetical protein
LPRFMRSTALDPALTPRPVIQELS